MKKYVFLTLLLLLAAASQAQQSPKAKHTLTIKYLYGTTLAQAAPDTTLKLDPNVQYSVTSPTIVGYTPDRPVVSGKMPNYDVTDSVLYTINNYNVVLTCSPQNGGTVTGAGRYNHGSQVTVGATANAGFHFVEWKDGNNSVSTNASYSFVITSNKNLTAVFAENKYTITVDPAINHGTVTVSPANEAEPGQQVTITATPANNYELSTLRVYKKDDESQTVTVSDNKFTMPSFDVIVSAEFTMLPPVINGTVAAQSVCSGDALTLTAPSVTNADRQGWEIAPDDSFQVVEAYTGQALNASYNGWKLRYWATNAGGTSYSNVVGITVNVLEPTLTGDLSLCTMQNGTYTVTGADNATLTWTVSDDDAALTESGKTLHVTWANAGQHTITLTAENQTTGCTATTTLNVTVISYIDGNSLNKIVAKQNNGKDYILIYPNPQDAYKYQWYKDGQAIRGATGQYLYQAGGLDAGNYKVYISYNADTNGNLFGGAFTKAHTVESPVSISLNPNPAPQGSTIHITNTSGQETLVSIYTLDGRLVHQQTVTGTNASLDLNLTPGLYLVKMNDHQNEYNEKLIVK